MAQAALLNAGTNGTLLGIMGLVAFLLVCALIGFIAIKIFKVLDKVK